MLTFAIVDDDDYDRRHLHRLLTRVTYEMGLKAEILLFDNGLDFLSAACCDLVFMDIHMDPLDGLETARILREKCMTVFLVFMTAGEDQYPAAFSVRATISKSRWKKRRSGGSWKMCSGLEKNPSLFSTYRRMGTSKYLILTSAISAQTVII